MENYFAEHNIEDIYNHIQNVYLSDDRPWILGYSGGKDSSTVAQLVFNALHDLKNQGTKLHKPVYIISADTLVETPMIIDFITNTLNQIEEKAKELNLPIKAQKVYPKPEETFWSLLIGKGYPNPRQKFRWCTDRLKIKPTTNFIKNKLSEYNEVIVLLGVRKGESASRDQVLKNSKLEGKVLRRHQSLNNAYIFAPIEKFTVKDVWAYLLQHNNGISPWETDNNKLYNLYRNSDTECPMVINKNTKACGNSRFGCWVCTVVTEDKSLKGFIKSGEKWLKPLLKFRNWLYNIRDDRDKREKKRRNGVVYKVKRDNKEVKGLGAYTLEARKEILEKLLKIQKRVDYKLIQGDELKVIRKEWLNSGDLEDSLPEIYEKIYNEPLPWELDRNYLFDKKESNLLSELCQEEGVDPELLKKLLTLEATHLGYDYRHNIYKEMKKLLSQDWIHYDDIENIEGDISESE
ncbi:DNA phosphorothioation system sulfurtransferase DndC [Halanaerocella petrolearia]